MCEIQQCTYYQAEQLARSIVESNPAGMLEDHTQRQKLAELAGIELVFEKVAPECEGVDDEGKCKKASLINDTRSFIFGTPGIPISGRVITTEVGIRPRG